MAQPYLPLEAARSAKPFWRRWKWLGLLFFFAAILLRSWLPGIVVAVCYLWGLAVFASLLLFAGRYLRDKMFWRVRNRLLAAFVFVGLIPIVVLFGLGFLLSYLLLGQLAATYFSSSLQELQGEVAGINGELAGFLPAGLPPASFEQYATRVLKAHADLFPKSSARLLKAGPDQSFEVIAAVDPGGVIKPGDREPAGLWLAGRHDFDGLIFGKGTIRITSLKPVRQEPGFYLEVAVPLDSEVERRLAREKSIYVAILGQGNTLVRVKGDLVQVEITDEDAARQQQANAEAERLTREMLVRSSGDQRRMISFGTLLEGIHYDTGKKDYAGVVVLRVPLADLYGKFLSPSDLQGKAILRVIYALAGVFVFVEIVSLVIGLTISRRVTRSVHDLVQGTLALQKGDLQHRIPVRRNDQLGHLARSFNQMSEAITRLLAEVSEKKRLEQELEIAREVQATLFPKQLPHPRGMAIFGGCEAARTVSGDYYDFIVEDEARLHIVIGDISGKGISAALLMANLHAAMRGQLLSVKSADAADIEKSLAAVMTQLNQQIYLNSPPEKYATLFAGRFDAESRRFSYSNAGHLAPILLNGSELTRLEATGTVLGLFPDQAYEARSVDLRSGMLLAVFTDGVTEAVNGDDEEYGEERLIETLREYQSHEPDAIYRQVVARVRQWQGDLKQHDDITLIVAKAV